MGLKMNNCGKNFQMLYVFTLILFMVLGLTACGDEAPAEEQITTTNTTRNNSGADTSEQTEAYRAKVSNQVNDSYLNTMVRNWNITREQAECLLGDHKMTEILKGAEKDPAIRSVIVGCGVDPSVVK